ncbi:DUF805 domain-containing protein [Hymenobacter ruber]
MAFFTAAGRLRRRAYFVRVLCLYAAIVGIYAIPGLVYPAEIPIWMKLSALVVIIGLFYLVIVQALRRLHDLDLRAWWFLVALLPLVSYVLGAGMQFVQGTIGPNRFGLDPKRPLLRPAAVPIATLPPEADVKS